MLRALCRAVEIELSLCVSFRGAVEFITHPSLASDFNSELLGAPDSLLGWPSLRFGFRTN
jgi:hypothetical protein